MSARTIASLLVFVGLCFSACGVSAADVEEAVGTRLAPAVAATLAAVPTSTAWPTLAPYPTLTPYPTATPYPTYTPQPIPSPKTILITNTPTPMPVEFLYLEGKGNRVSDNFEWQRCEKAVFSWGALGRDNFIVALCKVDTNDCRSQVNEIGPMEGEFLQGLLGGTYYFSVELGPQAGWWIKGECRD